MEISEGYGLKVTFNENELTIEWCESTHPEYNFLANLTEEGFCQILKDELERLTEKDNPNKPVCKPMLINDWPDTWPKLSSYQRRVIADAIDLVNGELGVEERLFCYNTILNYVSNSTYNEPGIANEM